MWVLDFFLLRALLLRLYSELIIVKEQSTEFDTLRYSVTISVRQLFGKDKMLENVTVTERGKIV